LATGSEERRLSFVGNAASTLANNSTIDVAANARVRVGRALGIRLVATASRSPVKGALSLTYRASARKLVGRTDARGTVTLGQGAGSAFAVGVTSARVLAAGTQTTVVLTGTVGRSKRGKCKSGTAVTLRLVDRDFRTPRTTPDVVALQGKGCSARFAGEVSTG